MERFQRARNLLIQLEALKEQDGMTASPLGTTLVVGMALTDAEILAREVLTELTLREGLKRRKQARARFPGVRRAFGRVAKARPFLRSWARKATPTQGGTDTL